MANTQAFCVPNSLSSSFLTVNADTLSVPGIIVANSTGVNVAALTADNVFANGAQSNIGQYLSLVANLISMNVLSGNNQTLLELTSNQAFVNSLSGNTGTGFLTVTANQIFANSITGNNISIPSLTSSGQSTVNTIAVGGNATAQTIIGPNGIFVIDSLSATPQRLMPAEVVLQKGSVSSSNNFLVNFASEVESGLYKSMRMVWSNVVMNTTDSDITMRLTTNGLSSGLVTSGYSESFMWVDGFVTDPSGTVADDNLDGESHTGQSRAIISRFLGNNSFRGWLDLYLNNTTTTAGRRSWACYSMMGVDFAAAQLRPLPMPFTAGGLNTSTSMVIKGAEFRCSTSTMSLSWTLIGRRWI